MKSRRARTRRPPGSSAPERLRERALDRAGGDEFAASYARIARGVTQQRLARELSQKELAELCATTQSAVARLEAGERAPRVDTLLRIANALDCELVVELRPRTRPKKRSVK
jgi:ribosome-binding protein aMBF1 (putative translation factor)